jgi:hypothetical protein
MKSSVTLLTVAVLIACAAPCFAEGHFPEQEATVTITVTTPDGTVIREEAVTENTEGADTTAQYKALQKMSAEKKVVKPATPKADKKPAVK